MWNELGAGPSCDEIELSVMGPGHGEAIVAHLGNGNWMVVDSCLDLEHEPSQSAPLKYLRKLGVQTANAVKLILVSHWDSDHIGGISLVVEASPAAKFCCSTAFTQREFVKFVSAMSVGSLATEGANVSEFHRVLQILNARKKVLTAASPGRRLQKDPIITTWSPSDYEAQLFLQFVAQEHPKAGQPMRRAIPGSPNLTSVVVGIDWEDTSVLLGADMESHVDDRRGWGAIVSTAMTTGFAKSNVVKVPHHGSHTGHDDRMWQKLLSDDPISIIAPFGKGKVDRRPPKPGDVRRINELSATTYITARRQPPKSQAGMPLAVRRSLREGSIRFYSSQSTMGIVRLRRKKGQQWTRELFGAAVQAK